MFLDNKAFEREWQAVQLPTRSKESVNYVETTNDNIIVDLPSGNAKTHKIPITEDILELNNKGKQGIRGHSSHSGITLCS